MTMTCQEQHCIVYLTLREDKEPPIHLHNNCGFPLYFGQSFTSKEVDTGKTATSQYLQYGAYNISSLFVKIMYLITHNNLYTLYMSFMVHVYCAYSTLQVLQCKKRKN